MANPIKGIIEFLKTLSNNDVEASEDYTDNKLNEELEQLRKISGKNIKNLEDTIGNPTLTIKDDANNKGSKEDKGNKDRLGIERPKVSTKSKVKQDKQQTKPVQVQDVGDSELSK